MTGGMRRGGRAPRPQRRGNDEKEVWIPVTNLGRLVKAGAIKSIEEIYLHSLAIKESQVSQRFAQSVFSDCGSFLRSQSHAWSANRRREVRLTNSKG